MTPLDATLGAILAVRGELDSLATGQAYRALESVLIGYNRRCDLRRLAALVAVEESRWQTALQLEARLSDFETRSYPRIAAGHRAPRNEVESLMARILADASAPCARTVWAALRD